MLIVSQPSHQTGNHPTRDLQSRAQDNGRTDYQSKDLSNVAEDRQQKDTASHKGKPVFSRLSRLTKDSRDDINARHTPTERELCRAALQHTHLREQGTDTVRTPFIGTSLPSQSYLRFFARGPPLSVFLQPPYRQHPFIAPCCSRKKKPQKGRQSQLRLFRV